MQNMEIARDDVVLSVLVIVTVLTSPAFPQKPRV
jgi:hypothetical protein